MKQLFFVVMALAISAHTYAQKNFIPGSITKLNGEVVQGFINDEGWFKSPEVIEFKEEIDGNIQVITPQIVKSFKTANSKYISANINMIRAEINTNRLTLNYVPEYIKKDYFLKTIIESEINLYSYKDSLSKDHFLIQKNNEDIIELIHFKYLVKDPRTGRRILTENKNYIGQLRYLLSGCDKVNTLLKSISYTEKKIKNIVLAYINCNNYEAKDYKPKVENEEKFDFYIKAGAGLSTMSFEASTGTSKIMNLAKTDFSYSLTPIISASFSYTIPYWNNRFSVFLDANYTKYEVSGSSVMEDFWSTFYYDNHIEAQYAGTLLGIKYNLNSTKINPYVALGISSSFLLGYESNVKIRQEISTITNESEEDVLEKFRTYAQGVGIEIGVEYKWFVGGIRYQKDNGISSLDNLNSHNHCYTILIGYKF